MEQGHAWAFIRWCSVRAALGRGSLLLAGLVSPSGCSPSSPTSAPPRCDPSHCAPGSDCIDDGSDAGPSCRKVCTQQADCPFSWYCNDAQPKSGCVPSTIPLTKHTGQWGELCPPECNTLDTFDCYGTSPTDANAFCTLFDCAQDSDCKGGWWCATLDLAPNVTTTKRSFGPTRTVCLPRAYCDGCQMDHDCPLAADGTQQHCVQDSSGNGFCSPQCATGSNCPLDATCTRMPWGVCAQMTCATDADCVAAQACFAGVCRVPCARDADCPASNHAPERCSAAGVCVPKACASDDDCAPTNGTFQHCSAGSCTPECAVDTDCNGGAGDQRCVPLSMCMPRAGVCRGDGSLCAPCRSDADCPSGYCLAAPYSTERFCSQTMKSGTTCSSTGPPPGSCPTLPSNANYKGVACTAAADDFAPANQCVGLVTFGTVMGQMQHVPGCWTVNR
jgi:hypothetical protein